jgi:demethylmenaquinone methyltransferase/2-methoxy-6-polyprenyl-1,4-benzoquinol methylase
MGFFERGLGSVANEVPPEIPTDRRRFPSRDLASRYDAAAPHWHRRMRWLGYPEAYARLFARLQAAARLRSLAAGGRVLDCGIGTGVLSLALAYIAPVQEVVGVDIAPAMLREAAANLAAAGIPADLRRADAHRLPQPDASFDAVVSAHMLEHLARPKEAISEMVRVLRPGAPLVIVATRGTLADQFIRLKWRHVPIGRDQLITWMRSLGLRDIEVRDVAKPLSPSRWLSRAFVGRRSL